MIAAEVDRNTAEIQAKIDSSWNTAPHLASKVDAQENTP